jgi:hypothetical protein
MFVSRCVVAETNDDEEADYELFKKADGGGCEQFEKAEFHKNTTSFLFI